MTVPSSCIAATPVVAAHPPDSTTPPSQIATARMNSHEILQTLSDERCITMINELREAEPSGFKAILLTLAEHRRLRPIFVQKKPRPEQAAWILKNLRLRSEETLAQHLLQIWLIKTREEMIVRFLDAAEIDHDGEGMVEDLPESLDPAKVKAAVEPLFEKFGDEVVAIYLHAFQLQREGGWPAIAEILENDPRARLVG